jgi:hypothetical protein
MLAKYPTLETAVFLSERIFLPKCGKLIDFLGS